MLARAAWIVLLLGALSFLAACDSPQNGSTEKVSLEYLMEEIPPCTPVLGSSVDPCDPNAMGIAQSFPDLGDEPYSIRKMLDDDPPPPAWVTHLVLRGTYIPGTVRCTAGDLFRPASYLSDEFGFEVNPRGIKCYVDIRSNAYALGFGPSTLTVLLFHRTYWDGEYALEAEEGQTEQDVIEEMRQQSETDIDEYFPGREHVIFLGPAVDLSSEAWQVVGIWEVQRRGDGTVIAVHPHRDPWRKRRPDDYQAHLSVLEMELPAFTRAVTTANEARVAEYGGRIGAAEDLPMLVTDANELREYYTEVGAYDPGVPAPSQPPPP